MSKTHIYCHIVFGTKRRERTIFPENKKELYKYIWGIITNKNCTLLRINGVEDHVHILIDLHPSVALAELVRDIKTSCSHWIKGNHIFPYFNGWGKEYYASSLSPEDIEACKQYIISQEEHHRAKRFEDEMKDLSVRWGLAWYEDDLS